MDAHRFDRIAQLFAQRRFATRQAAMAGGAATAQDAPPPIASPGADYTLGLYEKITYLFVQSFQSGSIEPAGGSDDRYTVTLESGLGQTIFFGDRPSRAVGVSPTGEFLEGLGFSEDNPPNAALLVETGGGETDIAVVELFDPTYDEAARTATYQVRGLEAWADSLDLGLAQDPADLAGFTPAFGAAHLFIDDCADGTVECFNKNSGALMNQYTGVGYCYNYAICMPCDPYGHTQPDKCSTLTWWGQKCTADFPDDCKGGCTADFAGSHFLGC